MGLAADDRTGMLVRQRVASRHYKHGERGGSLPMSSLLVMPWLLGCYDWFNIFVVMNNHNDLTITSAATPHDDTSTLLSQSRPLEQQIQESNFLQPAPMSPKALNLLPGCFTVSVSLPSSSAQVGVTLVPRPRLNAAALIRLCLGPYTRQSKPQNPVNMFIAWKRQEDSKALGPLPGWLSTATSLTEEDVRFMLNQPSQAATCPTSRTVTKQTMKLASINPRGAMETNAEAFSAGPYGSTSRSQHTGQYAASSGAAD